MSWCPKCKTEYENHVKTCAECHVELVDYLEPEEPEEYGEYEDITKLCNVASLQEATMIKSLLDAYGIPVLNKSKGSGDYLQIVAGVNYQGVDIYVPVSSLDEARKIMNEGRIEEEENVETDPLNELNTKVKNIGRLAVYLLILFFLLIPLVIGLISFVFNAVRNGL